MLASNVLNKIFYLKFVHVVVQRGRRAIKSRKLSTLLLRARKSSLPLFSSLELFILPSHHSRHKLQSIAMKSSVLILSAVIFGLVKCEKSAVDILVAEYLGLDPPEADRNNFEANAKLAAEMTRSKSISLKVARGGPEYPSHYKLNVSSICLFDSVDNFVENFKSINWLTNKRFRHPHLVYIPGATLSDILSSIHDGFSIDHVGFLVDGVDGSIELVTNFMYTSHACRANQLMTVNRFSGVEGKWETSIFYPNKYNDFHGCTLTVASYCDVLTELQSSLNFKSEVKYRETLEDAIKDEQIDLLGGSLQYKGDKIFIASAAFATENIIYVGPPGEPYSQFEKMFLPFDEGAWIAICCTFLFLLVAIQVVGFCSMTVQNFVYGRNIRTPTMNLFDIFLNGGQRKVPGRNFSRFMLTLFLVWSLIIRTCYQSKLFEFLQADMRKPGPRTLQDLGYVLVGNKLTPINPGDNMMYTPTKFDEPTRSEP